MKVFSSLALANFEHCVDENVKMQNQEDGEMFKARLNIASVQAKVLPEVDQLVPMNRDLLDQCY